MLSTPLCTFPNPIRSKRLVLNGLATSDDEAMPALQDLMSNVVLAESLVIQVTTGGIAEVLARVSQGWSNICQLTLSGGTHAPAPFFEVLASFPRLQSLSLQDIRLEGAEQGPPAVQFKFPAVITTLSLVRSSNLWPFFRLHVLPGHGLASVGELYVEERFCFMEEGVSDMIHGLRRLDGIPSIKLRAIYGESAVSDFRDLSMCCYTIFSSCFR